MCQLGMEKVTEITENTETEPKRGFLWITDRNRTEFVHMETVTTLLRIMQASPDMRKDFRHAVLNDRVGVDDAVEHVLIV